ncbi:hypothetical protein SteCoe_8587 [Stentor coeruleus]|uniref:Uncharacterized protein n=1 Tax=Stentor coeruleus TaxID=5963 RepID=A0A1R2CK08_9CILI|nr:hypothetical protein SteCoe_8587 [Stentor coeruleus]
MKNSLNTLISNIIYPKYSNNIHILFIFLIQKFHNHPIFYHKIHTLINISSITYKHPFSKKKHPLYSL